MRFLKTLLCCGALLTVTAQSAESREALRYDWPLFIYNFGGLEKYSIEDQVNLLQRYGYAGMAVDIGNATKLAELERYQTAAKKADHFKIYTRSTASTMMRKMG